MDTIPTIPTTTAKARATEDRNPRSYGLHRLSPRECVTLILDEDREVPLAVSAATPAIAEFCEAAAERFCRGGRLVYLGAGTSGRLGVLDASELPPTFHCPPDRAIGIIAGGDRALRSAVEGAEDDATGAREALETLALTPKDIVIGITTSGTTPYVVGGLKIAKELCPDLLTCAIACCESEIAADHTLVLETGPEVVTGSTRMKAGTATKMVLNAISTALMVVEGRVYDNLMVDLSVSNKKLRARAERIVKTVTGVSDEQASRLLEAAGGCPKVAAVMEREGVAADEARARLAQVDGTLWKALKSQLAPIGGRFRLVIDGGATKTRCFVLDDRGSKVALWHKREAVTEVSGGPCNLHSRSLAAVTATLYSLLQDTSLEQGGASLLALAPQMTVEGGIAGLGGASERRTVEGVLTRLGFGKSAIRVASDSEYLLGLLGKRPGVVVIAGTGSSCLSFDGTTTRVIGGLGHVLGDEGSGYGLGKAALASAFAAERGWGAATALAATIKDHFKLSRVEEALLPLNHGRYSKSDVASLAPLVLELADGRDAVAAEIVEQQFQTLANQASIAIQQAGEPSIPVHLVGGVFGHPVAVATLIRRLPQEVRPITYEGRDPFQLAASTVGGVS